MGLLAAAVRNAALTDTAAKTTGDLNRIYETKLFSFKVVSSFFFSVEKTKNNHKFSNFAVSLNLLRPCSSK